MKPFKFSIGTFLNYICFCINFYISKQVFSFELEMLTPDFTLKYVNSYLTLHIISLGFIDEYGINFGLFLSFYKLRRWA